MLFAFVFCIFSILAGPLITIALFATGHSYSFIIAFFILHTLIYWALALYFHPYGRGGEYIDKLVDKVLRTKK